MVAMTPREQEISDEIRRTITRAMTHSDRSLYSAEKKLGISDLGHCREYTRLTILGTPDTDEQDNFQAAFNGTAIGDLIEKHLPYETQGEVIVTIPMRDGYKLSLIGHPDIIVRDEETGKVTKVWDNKSKSGLQTVRNYGASENNIWQVTAYGKALIDAGEADADNLELALIYVDRSGDDPSPHVKAWQWQQSDWEAIVSWLDDVVEALVHDEQAPKDMPRDSFCQTYCELFTACRSGDSDVQGLIEHDEYVQAVEAYLHGADLERQGKQLKKEANSVLRNVTGNVNTTQGMKSMRWVHVNGSHVEFDRAPYERLSITKAK